MCNPSPSPFFKVITSLGKTCHYWSFPAGSPFAPGLPAYLGYFAWPSLLPELSACILTETSPGFCLPSYTLLLSLGSPLGLLHGFPPHPWFCPSPLTTFSVPTVFVGCWKSHHAQFRLPCPFPGCVVEAFISYWVSFCFTLCSSDSVMCPSISYFQQPYETGEAKWVWPPYDHPVSFHGRAEFSVQSLIWQFNHYNTQDI